MKKMLLMAVALVMILNLLCAIVYATPTNDAYTVTKFAKDWVLSGEGYAVDRCVGFVNQCIKRSIGRSCSRDCAYCAWLADGISTSSENIPLGAAVYFKDNRTNVGKCSKTGIAYGHIALYVGDGYVVHTYSGKICKETLQSVKNWKNYTYLGWGWHGGYVMETNDNSLPNGHIHHNFKHDVANEKCFCGETFKRQYENINKTYTVATSTSIKTKPYADFGERVAKLNKGDKVYVKRSFKNVYDNVWCEVEAGNKKGYMYFGSLKVESSLNINLTAYPTAIKTGSSFGLRGTISSNYDIKKISGYIMQGNTVCQSTVDTPNSKSVDVRDKNLNKKLLFDKLSAGNYSLYVEVVDSSGKVVGVSKNFSVYAEQKKSEASTLKINLERYPVSIKLGSAFSVRGNITSNYSISRVRGYIYDTDGSIVQSTTDTPNSTYMEIRPANLNQKLIFNKLSAGNYTMKVEAVDASGKVVTATKPFKVGAASNTPKPSETTSKPAPSNTSTSIRFELESVPKGNLPYGKAFSLKGWFRSDSAIVEARAYMLDSNKNIVMQSDKASSTTSNYKIQGYKLDKAMQFNKLSPGGYYLKYYVKDANGDTATWISDKFYIVK